tara:strand:+ start:50 stop:520 length:471 start_codon:yes stop_codon:yes gene_type:complete
MKLLGKVTEFIGSQLFGDIKDTVMAYFPPNMNQKERAQAELSIQAMLHAKQIEANKVLADSAAQLDRRIAEQEGTAKDLLAMPVLGRVIIFARGAQRPVWGFSTLYMDHQWFFSGGEFNEQQQTAMITINVLVLGFLFGERAIKNLEPLLIKVFAK